MLTSVLLALALTIMPLPGSIDAFRPDWVMHKERCLASTL